MATLTSQLILSLVDRVTAPVRAVEKSISSLQQKIAKNNQRLDELRGRMVEAAAVGYGLYKALQAPIQTAAAFETKMLDIGQKADLSDTAIASLSLRIRTLARDLGASASGMAGGVDTLMGMGASDKDAMELIGPITKAVAAYGATFEDMSSAGYSALDNLKVPADQFGKALDAMAQAGKAGAFELKDMARYFPTLGAAYQGLKQTGVPAVGDLAAALQIVRKGTGDSASAATNLSNLLQKITAPGTIKKFGKLGVNLRKEMARLQAKGMTPIEAITELTNKVLKGDLSRLGELFEDSQVQQALRPLIQNLAEYRKIRTEALAAQGVVEEDFQRRAKTNASRVAAFQAALENISISIGNALIPAFNALLDRIAPVTAAFERFAEANPAFIRGIIGVTSALIGLRVAAIAAQWGFAWMRGAVLMSALGGMRALRAAIWAVQIAMFPFGAALRGAGAAMIAFAAASRIVGVGGALKIIGASALAALNPLRLLAGAVRLAGIALKVAFISTGVGAIIAGIAAAGIWIYNNWSGLGEMFSAFGRSFMAALGPAAPVVQKMWDGLKGMWDAVSNMLGPLDESGASWRAWGETLGSVAAGGVQSLIGSINTVIGALKGAYEWAVNAGSAVAGFFGVGSGGSTAVPAAATSGPEIQTRATGGPVAASKPYLVGEQGPELFVPRVAGNIVNATETARHLTQRASAASARAGNATANARTPAGGGGGPVNITFAGGINIQGGAAATPQQIRREFSREASLLMRRHFSDGIT